VAEGRVRGGRVSSLSASEIFGERLSPSSILNLPSSPELLAVLPDGYTIEVSPAAEGWWNAAARWLRKGKLMTFDYGLDTASELQPERTQGTLRAYRQHKIVEDVLAEPGDQDITAHVNFARIEAAGIQAGLATESFESQGRFLTRIAAEAWKPGSVFGVWDAKRTRQFQTLTHPEHLGNKFRTHVQSRR
jgi:SAM-dependent MidA family methyltransferase